MVYVDVDGALWTRTETWHYGYKWLFFFRFLPWHALTGRCALLCGSSNLCGISNCQQFNPFLCRSGRQTKTSLDHCWQRQALWWICASLHSSSRDCFFVALVLVLLAPRLHHHRQAVQLFSSRWALAVCLNQLINSYRFIDYDWFSGTTIAPLIAARWLPSRYDKDHSLDSFGTNRESAQDDALLFAAFLAGISLVR